MRDRLRAVPLTAAVAVVLACAPPGVVCAEPENGVPVNVVHTFEAPGDAPGFAVFTSNARHTIVSSGVTAEAASSGRRAYKIDVVFHTGSYCFLGIPCGRIPAAGTLQFSGRIRVGAESTGRAGLGLAFASSPPLLRNGNGSRPLTVAMH